jgi:hypothetical protein
VSSAPSPCGSPHHATRPPPNGPWAGAALLATGLGAILLGIDRGPAWGWTSAPVISLLALGTIALTGWVFVERRVATPLVSMRVFTQRLVLMSNISALAALSALATNNRTS